MDKEDYIQEGLRQLSDHKFYETLENDPTQNYNNQIYQILHQVTNLDIIDDKMKKTLYNKTPRIPNFYMLPKIHKPNIPDRPIVNGIGSITEKISAYVDQEIRHLVPTIPSYLKDTSHLLQILLGKTLAPGDILVAIDFKSLYTNIPHTEGIAALNKTLEETDIHPMKKLPICRLANLVLTKNYFTFNKKLYRQIGTAMGTRMAPWYANIFMKYVEKKTYRNITQETSLMVKIHWWYFLDFGSWKMSIRRFQALTK